MNIKSASFVISNSDYRKCPKSRLPEYAFVGRSNVGKSSLINMLTNQKKLAMTSSRPGKTQLINHFLIDETWLLADLPGYGYAQTGKEVKKTFAKIIYDYLSYREQLTNVFLLIDSRHPDLKIDLEFMIWLGEHGIPFSIVLTKIDKLKPEQLRRSLLKINHVLEEHWEEYPPIFQSSSLGVRGRDQILEYIETINASLPKDHI